MRGGVVSLRGVAVAAGVAVLALIAQIPILDRSAVFVDEGQLVTIAARILRGEVLYRDVYTGIFPGIYHLTALLFRIFGEDVVVTRWAQALVNAATAAALWLLGVRVMRAAWACLAPVLYLGLIALGFPGLSMLNYSPLALVFALYALLFLVRYLESAGAADGLAAGLLLGACGLVKQNFGALGVMALGLVLVWGRRGAPLGRRSVAAGIGPLALGAAGPGIAVLAAFALAGALTEFVQATLLSIGGAQLGAFNDPLPPILGPHPADDGRFVFVYTPAALFNYLMRGEEIFGAPVSPLLRSLAIRLAYGGTLVTLLAGFVVLWLERARPPADRRRATAAVVLFAGVFFLGIFPSAIWSHLAFVLAPVLLVLGVVGDRVHAWLARRAAPAAWAWGTAFAALAAGALALGAHISVDLRRWHAEPLGVARASIFVSPAQRELLRGATRFLEGCAGPEDPVFVAPDMPLVYFLSGRRNPTPYDLLIPGAIDSASIVERLRETGTRCVVYNPRMYLQFAPFEELFPEVAAELESGYRRAAVIAAGEGEWHGLVRRHR